MANKSATIITKRSGNKAIKVVFPFDYTSVAKIKSFTGSTWSKVNNCWYIPLSLMNVKELERWGCFLSDPLKLWVNDEIQRLEATEQIMSIPGLKGGEPYRYQWQGISFIEKRKGRALIADDMGLGKTLQALAWLQLHPEHRPAVISVPASVKLNWARECHKWMTHSNLQIISGENSIGVRLDHKIIIISHNLLNYPFWEQKIIKAQPKVVIVDEVHYFKNEKTKRSIALKNICKKAPHLICLSGTPILNKPIEIYFIANLIDKNCLPHWPHFTKYFCNAKNNGFVMDYNGAAHTEELYTLLSESIMIRRKKTDPGIADELPEKTYSFIPLEISNRKQYEAAEHDFILYTLTKIKKELEELNTEAVKIVKKAAKDKSFQLELFDSVISKTKQLEIQNEAIEKIMAAKNLVKPGELRRMAALGIIEEGIEWIKEFLLTGEKLVVFVNHKKMLDLLVKAFPKNSVKIDGGVTGLKRQQAVDQFQTNLKIRLFFGNSAAEEGITLTAACNVCHLEYPWNPGKFDQRNDRCHRIGAKFPVTIHCLFPINTIVDKLDIPRIDSKRKIIDSALDGKKTEKIQMLKELIKIYKK